MRAFLAVDVVLVLVFIVVLLVSRTGGSGAESTTALEPSSQSQTAESPSSSPQDDEAPPPDGDEGDDASEAQMFASPSGNIVCSISPEAASCSIAELSDQGLVEDDSCDGTVGHVVQVGDDGAERPCIEGDPPGKAPQATPELDYEESTSAFGYTCTSSRSGIICRHDATGHGFSIARAGSSLF